MLADLHVPAPLASNLVIIPTYRDSVSELALSSRNAYLRAEERPWAAVLIDALNKGQQVWDEQRAKGEVTVQDVLEAARESVRAVEKKAPEDGKGVEVRLIYVALNDPEELWDLEKAEGAAVSQATAPKAEGSSLRSPTTRRRCTSLRLAGSRRSSCRLVSWLCSFFGPMSVSTCSQ